MEEVSCRGMSAAFVEPAINAMTKETKAARQYIFAQPELKEWKELTTHRGNGTKRGKETRGDNAEIRIRK